MENGIKITNQNDYNGLREKLIIKNYEKYKTYFYNERHKLQKVDFDKWLNLYSPFKKMIDSIKKLEEKYTIAIATNNRKDSISPFLKNYKIEPKIISDSTISIDKAKQLEYIKGQLKADYEELHLVDDQVRHFPKLLAMGVNCYLAIWGYSNEEQREEAKNQGIALLKESNFYEYFNNLQ